MEAYNYENIFNFSCADLVVFLQKALYRCGPELERRELSISFAATGRLLDTHDDSGTFWHCGFCQQ